MGLSHDLILPCNEQNRAALARIFITPSCGITDFTAGELQDFTAVTMDSTADVWFEYEGEFESKSLNVEGTSENGTTVFTNTVEFKAKGLDKTKLKRAQELIDEGKVTVIIETVNKTGDYKRALVVGWDDIIEKDAKAIPNVNAIIEAELTGVNEITFTLVAKHAELVREFVGSIEANSGETINFGS